MDIDLVTKFFTLKEIYNLLCSTLETQIIIGQKLSKYLFKLIYQQKIELDEEILNDILFFDFHSVLIFLIQHNSKGVRLQSIECMDIILEGLFKDYKWLIRSNVLKYANFPLVSYKETFKVFLDSTRKNVELKNLEIKFVEGIVSIFTSKLSILIKNEVNNPLNNYFEKKICLNFILYLCIAEPNISKYLNNSEFVEICLRNITLDKQNEKLNSKLISCLFYVCLNHPSNVKKILDHINKLNSLSKKLYENCFKIEFINLLYTNTFSGLLDMNKLIQHFLDGRKLESKNSSIICLIVLKMLNDENYQFFLQYSDIFIEEFSKKIFDLEKEDKSENIMNLAVSIQISTKFFKYCKHREEEFPFILKETTHKSVIKFAEKIVKEIVNCNLKNPLNYEEKFFFLKAFLKYIKYAIKYPKFTSFFKTDFNIDLIFNSIFEVFITYVDEIRKSVNSKEKEMKTLFLDKNRNLVKVSYKILEFIINFRSENQTIHNHSKLSSFLFLFPNFLSVYDENILFKYTQLLLKYLHFKIETLTYLKVYLLGLDIKESIDELFIYITSNEDLRKSNILSNIININQSISSFSIESKSKIYLPFENDFLIQIIFSDKYDSVAKAKIMILLTLIFSGSQKDSFFSSVDYFAIVLKTFLNFREIISNNKGESIFNNFIKELIVKFDEPFDLKNLKVVRKDDFNFLLESTLIEFEDINRLNFNYFCKILLVFYSRIQGRELNRFNLLLYSNFNVINENLKDNLLFDENDIWRNMQRNKNLHSKEFLYNLVKFGMKYLKELDNSFFSKLVSVVLKNLEISKSDNEDIIKTKLDKFIEI